MGNYVQITNAATQWNSTKLSMGLSRSSSMYVIFAKELHTSQLLLLPVNTFVIVEYAFDATVRQNWPLAFGAIIKTIITRLIKCIINPPQK